MSTEMLSALLLFVVVIVGTPGPANILLMATGARWGARACMPLIAGFICGQAILNSMMALGLLALLTAQPAVEQALRIVSGLYLLWLAWRIAGMSLQRDGGGGEEGAAGGGASTKPGFVIGILFPTMNPKAWAMATSAFAQFTDADGNLVLQAAIILLVFIIVQVVAHTLWSVGGVTVAARLAGTVFERALMLVLALSVTLLVLVSMLRWI